MEGTVLLSSGELDIASGRVEGTDIRLTPTERKLVAYLVDADRVCSLDELLAEVWGYREGVRSRTVYSTVNRLRSKIEPDAGEPIHLVNDEGGYRFCPLEPEVVLEGLVGRDADLKWLRSELGGGPVALRGPGGVGKTTLARAVVAGWRGPDAWVDLRDVADVETALARIAESLEVDADAVVASLEMREGLLLVLDDLDVLDDPARLVGPLATVPGLALLCTSRPPVPGCRDRVLAPLAPDHARTLLVRSAQRSYPDAELDQLGEQLGRLPLALCLAAEWLDTLGPSLFTDQPLQLPGLRGSIERSWERLSAPAQDLLVGLAHLGADGPVSLVLALGDLPTFAELTALSLVTAEDGWYELSGPVRLFAAEKPCPEEVVPAASTWVQRTCSSMVGRLYTEGQARALTAYRRMRPSIERILERVPLVDRVQPLVDRVDIELLTGQIRGLERQIEALHPVLQPAERPRALIQQARLRLRLGGRMPQGFLDLDPDTLDVTTLGLLCQHRASVALQASELDEAMAWTQRGLDATDRNDVLYRRLAFVRAKIHRRRNEFDDAVRWLGELEVLTEEAADPVHRMAAAGLRGSIAKQQRRMDDAVAYLTVARDTAASQLLWAAHAHLTVALAQIGIHEQRHVDQARAWLDEAEAYYRRSGLFRSLGYVQLTRIVIELNDGEEEASVAAGRAAVRYFERSGDRVALDYAQGTLGRALVGFGRHDQAVELLEQMLAREGGAHREMIEALFLLARRARGDVGVVLPKSLTNHPLTDDLRRLLRPSATATNIERFVRSSAFDQGVRTG